MGNKLCPICNKFSLILCNTGNKDGTWSLGYDCLVGDHCFEDWKEVLKYRKKTQNNSNAAEKKE